MALCSSTAIFSVNICNDSSCLCKLFSADLKELLAVSNDCCVCVSSALQLVNSSCSCSNVCLSAVEC